MGQSYFGNDAKILVQLEQIIMLSSQIWTINLIGNNLFIYVNNDIWLVCNLNLS